MSKQDVIDDLCKCIEQANDRACKLKSRVVGLEVQISCGAKGHSFSYHGLNGCMAHSFVCGNCGLSYHKYSAEIRTDAEQKSIDASFS